MLYTYKNTQFTSLQLLADSPTPAGNAYVCRQRRQASASAQKVFTALRCVAPQTPNTTASRQKYCLGRLDGRAGQSKRSTSAATCAQRDNLAATATADTMGWVLFRNPLGVNEANGTELASSDAGQALTARSSDGASTSGQQDAQAAVEELEAQRRQKAWQQVQQTRNERAITLLEQLARCRRTPQIRLIELIEPGGLTRYTWDVDGGAREAASQVLASGTTLTYGAKLTFILPWLVATDTKLGLREIEYLGSQLRLCGLLQLDLARVRRRKVGMWSAQFKNGEELDRGSLVSATCALHRLVHRRGGLWTSRGTESAAGFASEDVYMVVCYEGVGSEMLSNVLAAYLHWFGGLSFTDAVKAAAASSGVEPSVAELEKAATQLCKAAEERPGKITLRWNWGGKEIRVAGDAVGDWSQSVPMRYYPREKCWKLQLWNLPPGRYHYKFIMDGKWVVDLSAPTEDDEHGNKNNVVEQTYGSPDAATDGRAASSEPASTTSSVDASGEETASVVAAAAPIEATSEGGAVTASKAASYSQQAASSAGSVDGAGTSRGASNVVAKTSPSTPWLKPFWSRRKAVAGGTTVELLLPTVRLEAARIAWDMKMRPMR